MKFERTYLLPMLNQALIGGWDTQEKSNIKTNIIKICTNISEKKVLNHDLNIHEVEVVTSESNANGNSKIKILIRI